MDALGVDTHNERRRCMLTPPQVRGHVTVDPRRVVTNANWAPRLTKDDEDEDAKKEQINAMVYRL